MFLTDMYLDCVTQTHSQMIPAVILLLSMDTIKEQSAMMIRFFVLSIQSYTSFVTSSINIWLSA